MGQESVQIPFGGDRSGDIVPTGHAAGDRIIGVEDHYAVRLEMAEEVGLRQDIVGHRWMPVQMVGRYIENGGHVRAQLVHRSVGDFRVEQFELKAAQLEHDHVICLDRVEAVQKRCTDVAADVDGMGVSDGFLQHFSDERCRCGFAAAAGDGDDRAGGQLHCEQAVVAQRDAASNGILDERRLETHAAAEAEQIAAVQQVGRMAAQGKRYRQITQLLQLFGQLLRGRDVADGYVCACGGEETGQSQSLAAHPQDNDVVFFKVERFDAGNHGIVLLPEAGVRSRLRLPAVTGG